MTRKQSVLVAFAASVFAIGAFGKAKPAYADACSGSDTICSGTCSNVCDVKDSTSCVMICQLTKKAEE